MWVVKIVIIEDTMESKAIIWKIIFYYLEENILLETTANLINEI